MNVPRLPVPDGGLRLVHARIVTGTDSAPVADGEVVVHGDELGYVGPLRPDPPPEDAELPQYDLRGHTVLPGFIDCHVHFAADRTPPLAALGMFPSHFHMVTANNLRRTLEAGITTARDLGGTDPGFRDAMAAGLVLGPRLHLAIGLISPTGGHADRSLANGRPIPTGPRDLDTVADSDDELRLVVRRLLRSGADVIKLCTSGGMTSPTSRPEDVGVPERQVRLVVEEVALRGGRPVAAHAQGLAGILAAVRGGATSVEHGYGVDDEALRLMTDRGTYLVPTLSVALRAPDPVTTPRYRYEKKTRWLEAARRNLAAAVTSGVRVAMGTDAGACPHGANLAELGHLVDLGMTPAQAVRAGTRTAAELLGYGDRLGTLETGKLADLVVTDADVLRDVHALADPRSVKVVVQGGRVVKDIRSLPGPDARPAPAPGRRPGSGS
ncbi:metal-dependent hydrolase family protein [Kitasatospora cineracea]|uniref:metal-dependent hydrolase family protein n=1 Tax=Kitasatospora cineracea TaxID=88074 RepID=UPI00379F2072